MCWHALPLSKREGVYKNSLTYSSSELPPPILWGLGVSHLSMSVCLRQTCGKAGLPHECHFLVKATVSQARPVGNKRSFCLALTLETNSVSSWKCHAVIVAVSGASILLFFQFQGL